MIVNTTRFGNLEISEEKVVTFPFGLPGFNGCVKWCLLHPEDNISVNWLQSVEDPAVALIIADPDVYFDNYDVRVDARELAPIGVEPGDVEGQPPPIALRVVLSVDPKNSELTANLGAPILINLQSRQAMQMPLARGAYSMRQPLPKPPAQKPSHPGDKEKPKERANGP